MTDLYERGTPIYKKLLAPILLSPLVLSLAALFIDFLPSVEAHRWGTFISVGLTLLTIPFFYYAHKKTETGGSYYSPLPKNKFKASLILAAIPLFLFFMLYECFTYTVPRICHAIHHEDTFSIVTISYRGCGTRSGKYFEFKEYDHLWFKQLHDIRENLWEQVKIGDKVLLKGTQSYFGFVVASVRLYPLDYHNQDHRDTQAGKDTRLIRKWFVVLGAIGFFCIAIFIIHRVLLK